jgi:DNA repair exonuclease SbcCD nuclease subunit
MGRGYDYWALGHVHEHAVLNRDPWIVYPGNLQGRSVRECGPKGAVLVDVDDGRITGTRQLIVDRARWLHQTVPLDGVADENGVLDAVREALRGPLGQVGERLTAVRVTLTGGTALHAALKASAVRLRDDVQAGINHIHEDAWLETLRIATTEQPATATASGDATGVDPQALLAGLEHDPEIRDRAEKLLALVRSKLPGGIGDGALDDLDSILADARATASGRVMPGGSATGRSF